MNRLVGHPGLSPYLKEDRQPTPVLFHMKNDVARQIGEELRAILERLKVLAKEERAGRGPDVEAIEVAVVNLDCAIEILTE